MSSSCTLSALKSHVKHLGLVPIKKTLKKDGFNKDYIKLVYSTLPQKLADQQVSFIIKKFKLKKGMKILDVGCGNGRHSLEFAREGYSVTGIDSSKDLIVLAKRNARKEKLTIKFTQKDMLSLPFIEEFDAVISIFSFGFLTKRDNHKIAVGKLARSLKKGGRLILATGNSLLKIKNARKNWIKNKKTSLITNISKKILGDGIVTTTKEVVDIVSMKQVVESTWKEGGKIHVLMSTMHLFTPNEIKKILTESGLRVVGMWSDFDNSHFSHNSKKLIISAIKKELPDNIK
ncbi:MAG: methyltransferase domain-containing protein [bacterium]|nr:methyltransferase domain-containing protein [bacterium]